MNDLLILHLLINTIPHYIFWKDKQGIFRGCNIAFARQFGLRDERDIIGKTDHDFDWIPEHRDKYIADDQSVVQTGIPKVNYEERQRQPDGSIKTLLVNKVPIPDVNHKIIGILVTYLDITELKQAQERALIAEKTKAQAEAEMKKAVLCFAGTIAHDLRTPLAAINIQAENLNQYLPEVIENYIATKKEKGAFSSLLAKRFSQLKMAGSNIISLVQRAHLYITNSLRSVKVAASGQKPVSSEELDVLRMGRCLQESLRDYPFKSGEKERLHLDFYEDFSFKGHWIFFNRILENLVKNAFEQLTLKNKGEIFIRCERGKKHNFLKIKDTAGGVTAQIINPLFSGMQSTKANGMGIGLTSTKQIMEAFGGNIKAHLVDHDCIELVLSFPKVEE